MELSCFNPCLKNSGWAKVRINPVLVTGLDAVVVGTKCCSNPGLDAVMLGTK